MRIFYFMVLSFLLLNFSSCKSQQKPKEENALLKVDSLKSTVRKFYLFKNKKLQVSEVNGSLTYDMADDVKTDVLKFSYEKDMDKAAFDGGYREEVVFEIPNNVSQQDFIDGELQNTKMLFGRYCFCRGQTGLYKVVSGKLHFRQSRNGIHFQLQFKINEVPQVTQEIVY